MEEDHNEQQESGNENEEGEVVETGNGTITISHISHHSLQDNTEYGDKYASYERKMDRRTRGSRQKFSQVWTKFTIVDHRDCLATCNICGARLSYKTTITNLAKHITRKHNYNAKGFKVVPFQQKKSANFSKNTGRPEHKRTLTELGGLDGLLLNVVADEGEDPIATVTQGTDDNNEQVVYAEEVGEYTYTLGEPPDETQKQSRFALKPEEYGNGYDSDKDPEYRPGKDDKDSDDSEYEQVIRKKKRRDQEKAQTPTRPTRPTERRNISMEAKKERMIDLQLECLELKKYNMQLEALAMEHQLCMPRSIFTEVLRGSNNSTRGTQTDVGGGNTKVFYVSDKNLVNGDQGSPQLFTFQARLNE